ncbi:hypothetical protein JKP88DRAFT_20262 [Tribonema minus]|uniref:Uncharacterized protein n=1 Tax=Tribonema minus TaxID=303371 RepID=A0A835Z9N9_9STRA|nr:hypothetical protein JKP88DRAFT_20262 [Tribonema minus]
MHTDAYKHNCLCQLTVNILDRWVTTRACQDATRCSIFTTIQHDSVACKLPGCALDYHSIPIPGHSLNIAHDAVATKKKKKKQQPSLSSPTRDARMQRRMHDGVSCPDANTAATSRCCWHCCRTAAVAGCGGADVYVCCLKRVTLRASAVASLLRVLDSTGAERCCVSIRPGTAADVPRICCRYARYCCWCAEDLLPTGPETAAAAAAAPALMRVDAAPPSRG